MYSRILCCALCALFVSPIHASIEITEDTTIDFDILDESNTVNVRGTATLTIDAPLGGERPVMISHINLWEGSSLVFRNADLRGDIRVLGDNKLDFLDGRFVHRQVVGSGNAVINIDGATSLGSVFEFSGGTQEINIHSFAPAPGEVSVRNSSGAFVNVFSNNPYYRYRPDIYSYVLGSVPLTNGSNGSIRYLLNNAGWRIYANDNRPDGDTNGDGKVDLEDLNAVRSLLGYRDSSGEALPLDGIVDLNDLNTVRNTFGESMATPVPEPYSLSLVLLFLTALYLQRAKLRQRNESAHC